MVNWHKRWILLAISCSALFTAPLPVHAQVPATPVTIVDRSPFIPSTFSPPQGSEAARPAHRAAAGNEVEFRGVYELAGDYHLLISESRSRSGKWLSIGETHENIELREYDPCSETATVMVDGEPRELQLAKLDANPSPQPVAIQSANSARTRTVTPTAVTPTPGSGTPVRRVIRSPQNRSQVHPGAELLTDERTSAAASSPSPPPSWLQGLREREAQLRTEAGSAESSPVNPGISVRRAQRRTEARTSVSP
jgi:hypothetical protein